MLCNVYKTYTKNNSFEIFLEHIRLPYCTSDYLGHIKVMYDLLLLLR